MKNREYKKGRYDLNSCMYIMFSLNIDDCNF